MTTNSTETAARSDEEDAVGTGEACKRLGISLRQLYNYIASGDIAASQLPSSRSGQPGVYRIEVAEIKAFLKRTRVPVST